MENKPLQECLMTGKSTFYPTPPGVFGVSPRANHYCHCMHSGILYAYTSTDVCECVCVPPFYQLSILVFLLYFLSHLYLFIINIGILLI